MPAIKRILNSLQLRLTGVPMLESSIVGGKSVLVRRGTLRMPPDKDDAWLLAMARHSHSVLDIGSNIGQAAMIVLLSDVVGQIVLVDPNPSALSIAAENVIRNAGPRIASFVCAFASDVSGESQDFWTVGLGAAGSMYATHAKTAARKGSHYPVPTITVDDITKRLRLDPDLVKIDVEGAEGKVLNGAVELANSQKARFFVEMHSSRELPMIKNAEDVLRWCTDTRYTAWYLRDHAVLDSPNRIADRGRCHLLLQPANWDYPEWLRRIEQNSMLQ